MKLLTCILLAGITLMAVTACAKTESTAAPAPTPTVEPAPAPSGPGKEASTPAAASIKAVEIQFCHS